MPQSKRDHPKQSRELQLLFFIIVCEYSSEFIHFTFYYIVEWILLAILNTTTNTNTNYKHTQMSIKTE